jgi:hypothetical protein
MISKDDFVIQNESLLIGAVDMSVGLLVSVADTI